MTSIPKVSLEDTLYLIQLARETALSKGQQQQANRMAPVVDGIRSLVASSRQNSSGAPSSAGILGQSDFRRIMEAAQTKASTPQENVSTSSILERNRLVTAMASSGMSDTDIARQFGISRDEVKLVINLQNKGKYVGSEVWK